MANRKTPLLGYLYSAVADNTAHSSIDRLLLEDEMNNQPSHSRVQLMGEQGNPDNPQRWIRKNYNKDGSIASTSFVGEPQPESPNPNYPKKYSLLTDMYEGIKPNLHRQSLMESLSQQPQHTMGVPDKPFEMRPEDALPIGGILRGGKGVLGLVKGQGPKVDYFRKQAEKSLLKEYENLEKQFRGRDIRKTLSSPAGKEQVKNSVLLDYILKSLKGKIKGQGLIE